MIFTKLFVNLVLVLSLSSQSANPCNRSCAKFLARKCVKPVVYGAVCVAGVYVLQYLLRKIVIPKIIKKLFPSSEEKLLKEKEDFVNNLPIDAASKKIILSKIESMRNKDSRPDDLEWIKWICKVPWKNSYKQRNISLEQLENELNQKIIGHAKTKNHILDYLALSKINPNSSSHNICLYGPPGVGKSYIAKIIAENLGRPFGSIALGGKADENQIRGERRSYANASPGKIVKELCKIEFNNPVILLDEIDKLGHSKNGGDPEAALLEVLDPNQNHSFEDNYLEIPIDLSSVFFVCTANDISHLSKPLLDRLEVIKVEPYSLDEKIEIGKLLAKKEIEQSGLKKFDWWIDDEIIEKLIIDYTDEPGVRNLNRLIKTICSKVARSILQNGNPVKINDENLRLYLNLEDD